MIDPRQSDESRPARVASCKAHLFLHIGKPWESRKKVFFQGLPGRDGLDGEVTGVTPCSLMSFEILRALAAKRPWGSRRR